MKELDILRARCPEIKAANLSTALKLLDAVRSVAGLSHYPSVRTGIQLARAFARDRVEEITERNVSIYFTYFAKNRRDAEYLKKQLPYLLSCVGTFHPEIDSALSDLDAKWKRHWEQKRGFTDIFSNEKFAGERKDSVAFDAPPANLLQNDFSFASGAM